MYRKTKTLQKNDFLFQDKKKIAPLHFLITAPKQAGDAYTTKRHKIKYVAYRIISPQNYVITTSLQEHGRL